MILASTKIVIDGPAITAFFVGLAALVSAVAKIYFDLRKVHTAVNSNATKAANKIDELHDRLEGLPYLIEKNGVGSAKKTVRKKPAGKRRK